MKKRFSVRTLILAGSLLLQLNTLCFQSRGAVGDVDLSFDPGSGLNGQVLAVAMQPDGKIIIGGAYITMTKGVVCQNIARLNADGSGDSSFAFAPNTGISTVRAIALQSDGKVLVAHDNGLSRFYSNGNLDTNFNPSILVYGLIPVGLNSVAVQSDGKILIGGGFNIVNAALRSGIARLNADGSLDNSFVPATVDGYYSGVFSIAVQPDGKVLIGGQSMTVDNGSIARLNANGSLDGTFVQAIGGGDTSVRSIAWQPDGKVLVGGYFASINGTNRNGIARLNTNGTPDASFNPATEANATVLTIALQPDGKAIIGGAFTTVNGAGQAHVARLNTNGSLDNSFNYTIGDFPYYCIALQPDGKVLIGPTLGRFNANGSRDGTFNTGTGTIGVASSLFLQSDGKVVLDGGNRRLNTDGSLDSTFNGALNRGPIVPQPDGKLLLGGIVRVNADWSVDTSFNTGTGPDYNPIFSVALQPDGKVLVGGEFETFNGTNCSGIARLNSDGSLDDTFIADISPYGHLIWSIVVQPDGKVLVGGQFSSVDGLHRYGFVRLHADGSLDSSFNPVTTGLLGEVLTIALQPDGRVLIGGYNGIARLHADGSPDGSFNPAGAESALKIVLQPDGRMLIYGNYHMGNQNYIQGIYRLNADGSVDGTFNPSGGLPLGVRSIALQPDGNVLIGGDFLTVNGVLRPYVARLFGGSAPSLNITRSNAFVILSWPTTGLNFQLQEATDLSLPNSWSPVAQPAVTNSGQISVTVPMNVGSEFFQLKSQ